MVAVVLSAFEQGAQCSTHSFGRQRSITRKNHACPPTCCCNEDILRLLVPRYIPTLEPASHLHKGQGSRKPHRSRTGTDRFHLSMAMYRHAMYRYATFRFHLSWPYIDTPCIDMPCIDIPRLGSTSRGHISIRHVFHCYHSLHRARKTSCHKFTHSRVIFQITLGDSVLDASL
jgi:hypothetical protein